MVQNVLTNVARDTVRRVALAAGLLFVADPSASMAAEAAAAPSTPLSIGETFTLESSALGETRRINVYRPSAWDLKPDQPLPVLYMPDGGIGEDFLHVAGLAQVLVGNGSMRPFLLVGIENTERRRDMTGPTDVAEDRKIAPRVGGSAAFRQFIATELMPQVRSRYRTTDETAIIGESLAGLFVVESLFQQPALFDTYIALDPSLWWNGGALVNDAARTLAAHPLHDKRLFVATSDEAMIVAPSERLVSALSTTGSGVSVVYRPMPTERHQTIYHPAALEALRTLFKPAAKVP